MGNKPTEGKALSVIPFHELRKQVTPNVITKRLFDAMARKKKADFVTVSGITELMSTIERDANGEKALFRDFTAALVHLQVMREQKVVGNELKTAKNQVGATWRNLNEALDGAGALALLAGSRYIDGLLTSATDGLWAVLTPLHINRWCEAVVGTVGENTQTLLTASEALVEGKMGFESPNRDDRLVHGLVGAAKVIVTKDEQGKIDVDVDDEKANFDIDQYQELIVPKAGREVRLVNLNPLSECSRSLLEKRFMPLTPLTLCAMAPLGVELELSGKKGDSRYQHSAFAAAHLHCNTDVADCADLTNVWSWAQYGTDEEGALDMDKVVHEPCSFVDVFYTVADGTPQPFWNDENYREEPVYMIRPSEDWGWIQERGLELKAPLHKTLRDAYETLFTPANQWLGNSLGMKKDLGGFVARCVRIAEGLIVVGIPRVYSRAGVMLDRKADRITASASWMDGERTSVTIPAFRERSLPMVDSVLTKELDDPSLVVGSFDPSFELRAPFNYSYLIGGPSGVGKTREILRLARWCANQGHKVVIVQSDEADSLLQQVMHSPRFDGSDIRKEVREFLGLVDSAKLHTINLVTLHSSMEEIAQKYNPSHDSQVFVFYDSITSILQAKGDKDAQELLSSGGVNPGTRVLSQRFGNRRYEHMTAICVMNTPVDSAGKSLQLRTQLHGSWPSYKDLVPRDATDDQKALALVRVRAYDQMNNAALLAQNLSGDEEGTHDAVDKMRSLYEPDLGASHDAYVRAARVTLRGQR